MNRTAVKFCGALIAVYAVVSMPHKAEASISYAWTSSFGTNGHQAVGSHSSPAYVHGFSDNWGAPFPLVNVNFVDLRMSTEGGNTSLNEPIQLVICTSVTAGICDGSSVIATSSSFTAASVGNASSSTWYRIYFPSPWTWSGPAHTHFYGVIRPVNSVSPSLYFYINTTMSNASGFYTNDGNVSNWTVPIRFGYDSLSSQSYYKDTIYYASTTACAFSFISNFSISPSDQIAYSSFYYALHFTVTPDSTLVPVDYSMTSAVNAGLTTNDFDCSDLGTGATASIYNGVLWGQNGTSAPVALISGYTPTILSLGSTTQGIIYGSDGLPTQTFLPGSLYGTSTPYTADNCTPWHYAQFGISACLQYLFVPSYTDLQVVVGIATSSLGSRPPYSWVYYAYDIASTPFTSYPTGTLPALSYTIPSKLPGAGSTLVLTPWPYMKALWDGTPTHTYDDGTTSQKFGVTVQSWTDPIVDIMFAVYFIGLAATLIL